MQMFVGYGLDRIAPYVQTCRGAQLAPPLGELSRRA